MTAKEKPKFIRYTKIWSDAEKEIPQLLDGMKQNSIERLKKLPFEQLPFAETRIRMLYFEAHYLTTFGFFNASIVISCILLEAILKEILFFRDKVTKDMYFSTAIDECQKRDYITEGEAEWLRYVKNNIRNWYVHSNIEKIAKDVGFGAWYVDLKTGEIGRDVLFGDDIRAIYDVAKNVLDTKIAIPFFLKVDKFTRKMCRRHFKTE